MHASQMTENIHSFQKKWKLPSPREIRTHSTTMGSKRPNQKTEHTQKDKKTKAKTNNWTKPASERTNERTGWPASHTKSSQPNLQVGIPKLPALPGNQHKQFHQYKLHIKTTVTAACIVISQINLQIKLQNNRGGRSWLGGIGSAYIYMKNHGLLVEPRLQFRYNQWGLSGAH